MRFLILILLLVCLVPRPVMAEVTDFDAFMKSREVVATLYFPANSESLPRAELERIAATITELRRLQQSGRMIRVEGFSSSEGDKETNFQLSFFRARTVADVIESKGVPEEVTLTGFGDLRAQSDNPLKERRVEIASYKKPEGLKRLKIVKSIRNKIPENSPDVSLAAPEAAPEIDSLTVEQAIRNKVADYRQRQLAEKQQDSLSPGVSQLTPVEKRPFLLPLPGVSQVIRQEITRDPLLTSPGLSQAAPQQRTREPLQAAPGLSQAVPQERTREPLQAAPGLSQAVPQERTREPLQAAPGLTQASAQERRREPLQAAPGFSQLLPQEVKPQPDAALPGFTQVMGPGELIIDALTIEQAIMEKIGAAPLPASGTLTQVDFKY